MKKSIFDKLEFKKHNFNKDNFLDSANVMIGVQKKRGCQL